MVTETIKQGFKQTEVGVIPEDWNVKSINETFDICNELRLPLSKDVRKKMQGIYPYYGPTKILDYLNEYRVEGEYALIGEDGDHFLKWRDMPMTQIVYGKFNVNNHAHIIKGKKNITITKWFYYFFKNRDLTHHLTRQGAGRFKLSKSTLGKILCAIPSTISEQRAIVEVLNDADLLIDFIDKLIAKKKNIKQSVMQELLTGKRRLPGFNGEWYKVIFDEIISNFTTGLNPRKNFILNSGGDFYYVTIKNFSNGKLYLDENCDKIDRLAFSKINKRSDLKKDDIIFASIGRVGDVYLIKETPTNWNINESVFSLRPNKHKIVPLFLYYLLTIENVKNILDNLITGSTFQSIKMADLKRISCMIPQSKEEQTAIGKILLDMDSEIDDLEKKRNKYQMIKEGTMQQLLTGRIRLK